MQSKKSISNGTGMDTIAVCPQCSAFNKLSQSSLISHRCVKCKTRQKKMSYKVLTEIEATDFHNMVVKFKSHVKDTAKSMVGQPNMKEVKKLILKRGNDVAIMNYITAVKSLMEQDESNKRVANLDSQEQDQTIELMNKAIEILLLKSKEIATNGIALKFDM